MSYNFKKIEAKWQTVWEKKKPWKAADGSKKKKFYSLIEFPYPSGDGLHVGHIRSNTAMDIISRKRRMEGHNVLYPIGWDAFGLPTENYAIKTGIAPQVATKKNTDNFRRQLKLLGFSFDWAREINTTDPDYYKWTQWIFLKFFEHGLAYKAAMEINWCPSCKIGLANEEVVNGRCDRCGNPVERREKEQWLLKITAYAEKLLSGLDKVNFLEEIKTQQRNWIGKSEGARIKFAIKDTDLNIEVFTTRSDTLGGVTYMVLAPEHQLVKRLESRIENLEEVNDYIKKAGQKSEKERQQEEKEKTGVELKGIAAINPLTKKEVPIWISDYVLVSYGIGAIMAVPAHDQRDWDFAKKFNLPIIMVICPHYPAPTCPVLDEAYVGEGTLVASAQFTGLKSDVAKKKITSWLEENNIGEGTVNYKLRDWVFSRQRYWGEPIPLVFCAHCAEEIKNQKLGTQKLSRGELLNPGWAPIVEGDLPVVLPKVKEYKPRDDGQSPLASVESWVKVKCPRCKGVARRETDTMPNWAGSSWYYWAYLLVKDLKGLPSKILKNKNSKLKYWLPVDWYNGGMEHVTLHLLYSRFWNNFLYDIGFVPKAEPYQKRTAHGLILGNGGMKMSKSKGNVVRPDELVEKFGADSLRLYEMFMGPFAEAIPWDPQGIVGMHRFLNRFYDLRKKISDKKIENDKEVASIIHKTIKKISEDIEAMHFNTAISALMICVNTIEKAAQLSKKNWELLIKVLFPFSPHIAQELWSELGHDGFLDYEPWPKWDKNLVKEDGFSLVIQINGKMRAVVEAAKGVSQKDAAALAGAQMDVQKWLKDKEIKKVIFVPDRLINFIT